MGVSVAEMCFFLTHPSVTIDIGRIANGREYIVRRKNVMTFTVQSTGMGLVQIKRCTSLTRVEAVVGEGSFMIF